MAGKGSAKGERRGGRKKGTPNKVTVELKGAAQKYTKMALKVLGEIAENGEGEAARVAACNALLDRGHGKPAQTVEANVQGEITVKWEG